MSVCFQSVRFASCALVVLASSGTLLAGPLSPPAGPITSTYKTLTEVEPRTIINATNTPGTATGVFRISQAGSYYLTGNITGVAGKHGIEVVASGVTLDLNGFTLQGVAGSLDGISLLSSYRRVDIHSGTIAGWGEDGIDAGLFNATVTVRGVRAASNGGHGINVGQRSIVEDCTSDENAGNGFHATGGTSYVLRNCRATLNTGDGIVAGNSSLVEGCLSTSNTGSGINASTRSRVSGCLANTNGLDGIVCLSYSTIVDNSCNFNGTAAVGGAGIHATAQGNTIEGNVCTNADRGIDVDGGSNFIARNTCHANTTNWDVVATNKCLVVLGVNAGAILGNAGGVSPGSTDPNANFSY